METAHLSSIEATAKYLGMTETQIWTEINAGRLAVVSPSNEYLIHEADLETFMSIPRQARSRKRVRNFLRNPVRNR